jgi:hypothetical protein
MNDFKEGDKVSFVIVSRSRAGGVSMKSREGLMQSIENGIAKIKYRGRFYSVNANDIRHAGQKNALTEALMKSVS